MFTIEMLPAEYGDCLWIEYGSPGQVHRILVDTGTPGTFNALESRIEKLPERSRIFDLFVITHVDEDHIGSALKLLKQRRQLGVTFRDVWFNGYVHLEQAEAAMAGKQAEDLLGESEDDLLGPVEGEELTRLLVKDSLPWNKAFSRNVIMARAAAKQLPSCDVAGMKLTVLSPGPEQLANLLPIWKELVIAEGLVPGETGTMGEETQEEDDLLGEEEIDVEQLSSKPFKQDHAPANGSSIVLLAEFEDKRVLLGADAFPGVMFDSLNRLQSGKSGKLELNAFKIPHHGSRSNISSQLLQLLDCQKFLVSTSGKKFKHPHREAIARIIKKKTAEITFEFNYRTQFNDIWDDEELMNAYGYQMRYGLGSAVVEL